MFVVPAQNAGRSGMPRQSKGMREELKDEQHRPEEMCPRKLHLSSVLE
jgi:hypothetical protein